VPLAESEVEIQTSAQIEDAGNVIRGVPVVRAGIGDGVEALVPG
jgi:hypothetical protein